MKRFFNIIIVCLFLNLFRSLWLLQNEKPILIDATTKKKKSVKHDQQNDPTIFDMHIDHSSSVVIDILAVGSNSRPEFVQSQKETWATHDLIRNFFVVTEDDDAEEACRLGTLDTYLAMNTIPRTCRKKQTNWYQNRIRHFYANPNWMYKKKNPSGWMCAQKRFGLGLGKILRSYKYVSENQNSTDSSVFPDYLLIVDDDTYYNLDVFKKIVLKDRDSNLPFGAAGCRVNNGHGKMYFAFGGFGATFSKGTLKKFLQPIHMDQEPVDDWEKHVHNALNDSLIEERPTFQNGMSVSDLMEKYTREEPFADAHSWKRGFCLHSDWFISYFFQFYWLGGKRNAPMETILNSEIREEQITGLCKNNKENCTQNMLACHYQTPESMQKFYNETLSR